MATTTYTYSEVDNLIEIADMYKTNVHTLVDLNAWLKDPIDGHTNLKPSKIEVNQVEKGLESTGVLALVSNSTKDSIYVTVTYSNKIEHYKVYENGTFQIIESDRNKLDISSIRFNKFNFDNYTVKYSNGSNVLSIKFSYIPSAKKPYLVVPVLGNGNSTAEDYWNIVDDALGIKHDVLMSNIISKSDKELSKEEHSVFNSPNIDFYTANLVDSEYRKNYIETYKNGSPEQGKNNLEDYTFADFRDVVISEKIEDAINNSALNFKKYVTRSDSDRHGNINKRVNFEKFDFNSLSDSNLLDSSKFVRVGNESYGKCKIWIGNTLLDMPCFPEQLRDGVTANYAEDSPLGRSEPYVVYTSTGARQIPFTFIMHREMTGNEVEIERIVKYIESAVYPNYNSSSVAATKVTVEIGNQLAITGVMKNQSTTWSGPIDENDKYKMVTVDFTIQEVTNTAMSASKIRNIGGFRTGYR